MHAQMNLTPLERVSDLSREIFAQEFLQPQLPVVITDLTADWPARDKWTISHFQEHYGDLRVPVYSANYSNPGMGYMAPQTYMPFLMDGFSNDFPFMFFGGQGSKVALHYDIDLSHVFLNQIHGRKRVVLFPPSESQRIYQLPFTVASYINIDQPDFERYPAQQFVKGFETILQPGETLLISKTIWHSVEPTVALHVCVDFFLILWLRFYYIPSSFFFEVIPAL